MPLGRLPKTIAALDYAQQLHAGQTRDVDGAAFILHPREVAALLAEAGAADHLTAAGALHDAIEKTPARASDVRERFGARVARLVLAVSEDRGIADFAARKAAHRAQVAAAGEEALMLFAADKISKVRELHLISTHGYAAAQKRRGAAQMRHCRLAHYRGCLRLLREGLPDSPLVALLEAELADLSAASARPPRTRTRGSRRGARAPSRA